MHRAPSLLFVIFLGGCAQSHLETAPPLVAPAPPAASASRVEAPAPHSGPTAVTAPGDPSPTLVIGAETVSVDGEPSGSTGALSTLTKVQRLDTLYFRLERRAEGHEPPVLNVRVEDGVPNVVTFSALATAAEAGLTRMRFGDVVIDYDAPRVDATGRFREIGVLGATVVLRLRHDAVRVGWQSSEPCSAVPADREVPLGELAGALRLAPFTSLHATVADDVPFRDVLAAIVATAPHRRDPLFVRLAPGIPSTGSDRFCGADRFHGRLAPELIQKVIRANFGSFRACYEEGLKRNASLQGRVATRFVIQRDGRVSDAAIDETSTLSDGKVTDCIRAGYAKLTFPKPDGGIVTVVYPLIFNPGD